MHIDKFISIVKKYKKCPNCGSSWKGPDLLLTLEDDQIRITCTCGFLKVVDENNKEVECK